MKAAKLADDLREMAIVVDDVVTTSEVTAVTVTLYGAAQGTITRSGVAKKDPKDRYNPEAGALLAMGRAIESLGSALVKRGNGLVKQADDIKTAKLKRAANPTPAKAAGVSKRPRKAARVTKKRAPAKKAVVAQVTHP